MAWLDWAVIPSIVLLAAVVIGARRQAERNEGLLGGCLGAAKRRFSTAPDTFSFYRHRFEQMKPLLGLPPSFGFLVEADCPYPKGHAQAVSWLAIQIAKQVRLSQAEIEEIRLAGLVHDIGKIHVPLHVLNKPALLTAEEFETMKSHAAWGAKMLEPLNVKAIERIVRHHHERFDGKGYPEGLAGDRIPLGARIVAVAECFQDMVSELPYKSARTFEDALAELRGCSGKQFDPKVVMAFLDWLQIHGDPREQQ
jgi:putative nucleotidyltransferase with HDIG domain